MFFSHPAPRTHDPYFGRGRGANISHHWHPPTSDEDRDPELQTPHPITVWGAPRTLLCPDGVGKERHWGGEWIQSGSETGETVYAVTAVPEGVWVQTTGKVRSYHPRPTEVDGPL